MILMIKIVDYTKCNCYYRLYKAHNAKLIISNAFTKLDLHCVNNCILLFSYLYQSVIQKKFNFES